MVINFCGFSGMEIGDFIGIYEPLIDLGFGDFDLLSLGIVKLDFIGNLSELNRVLHLWTGEHSNIMSREFSRVLISPSPFVA